MHPQRRISMERDMNLARSLILRAVGRTVAVVLAQTSAIANGFTQGHVMEKPKRAARPYGGQGIAGRAQGRSKEIAFVIPVPEVTANIHIENALDVGCDEVNGRTEPIARV